MWMLAADLKANWCVSKPVCVTGVEVHIWHVYLHVATFIPFFLTAVDMTSGGCVIFKAQRK